MSLKLFAGRRNTKLAENIFNANSIPPGDVYFHSFPSGESYVQFKENIRGDDVFLLQSITLPANENLMDICIMADAARRASAARITAVIPYMGYARQDRKDKSRVPISAKLVMDILQASGVNRVLTMDLHSPQIAGFTNLPFDHLYFEPVLLNYFKQRMKTGYLSGEQCVIVAPDVGAVKRAERYAQLLGCDFAFISKKRLGDDTVGVNNFIGDVNGKIAIVIDDLTESVSTLVQASEVCKKNGAKLCVCAVSHACFTPAGSVKLEEAIAKGYIYKFIHSDTVSGQYTQPFNEGIVELSVAPMFATAIKNIHNNESISTLFS